MLEKAQLQAPLHQHHVAGPTPVLHISSISTTADAIKPEEKFGQNGQDSIPH